MSRREFIALLASASVVWPFGAPAQDTSKIRRIGFLRFGEPPKAYVEGFRKGLRELGYIEGQTVAINFRLTQNAAELWVHAADLIVPIEIGQRPRDTQGAVEAARRHLQGVGGRSQQIRSGGVEGCHLIEHMSGHMRIDENAAQSEAL